MCFFCKHAKNDVLGLAFIDASGSLLSVSKFQVDVSIDELQVLTFEQYNLHVILNVDSEFLHTVLGLQSCSAKYSCCFCLLTLNELRTQRNFESGPLRSREEMHVHLENVNKGPSLAQKK